jgi:DNA-binding transcriptional LysR family regulator
MLSINISTATSDVLIEALNQGDLDLVIGRIVSVKHEDYVFRPIANETLSIVGAVNHPLAGKAKVTLEALHKYPWILQGPGSPMRAVIEREFRDQHLVLPETLIETSSILTTADIVTRTDMIAVIPESVAAIFADSGRIQVLRYRIKNKLDPYGSLIKRDRPASPATQAFLTMLHPPELSL